MSGLSFTLPDLDGTSMAQLLGLLDGFPHVEINTNGENAPILTLSKDNLDSEDLDSDNIVEELFERDAKPDSGSCPFMQYSGSRNIEMSWKAFVIALIFAGIVMFLAVSDEASKFQEEK